MLFIQLTGLSGAGKTSLAYHVQSSLAQNGCKVRVEVVDADEYRKTLCADLGFSKEDRIENIKRLGKIGNELSSGAKVVIIAAINPNATARAELKQQYHARTIWIKCSLQELIKRDTKGLYRRALAPSMLPDKIYNLTGVNDPYEAPSDADLIINTDTEDLETSACRLHDYIMAHLNC